jgi:hypothetical protein
MAIRQGPQLIEHAGDIPRHADLIGLGVPPAIRPVVDRQGSAPTRQHEPRPARLVLKYPMDLLVKVGIAVFMEVLLSVPSCLYKVRGQDHGGALMPQRTGVISR